MIAGRQTRKTVFVNLCLVKVSFDWGQYLESQGNFPFTLPILERC